MKIVLVAGALSVGFACAAYAQPKSITVELADTETALLGTATLTQGAKDVTIVLDLKGLMPGEHALHLHTTPECTGWAFASAGTQPRRIKARSEESEGPHAGDLEARWRPTAPRRPITATGITLARDAPNRLRKGRSRAHRHEGPDDMMTDPEGKVGERIGCGAIKNEGNSRRRPYQSSCRTYAQLHLLTFIPIPAAASNVPGAAHGAASGGDV
jgi:Cu-Zn family superoxide dismutase